jgi:hypothetical protein
MMLVVSLAGCGETNAGPIVPDSLPSDQIPPSMQGFWMVPASDRVRRLATGEPVSPFFIMFRVLPDSAILSVPLDDNPTATCPPFRMTRRGVYRLEVLVRDGELLARLPQSPERFTVVARFEHDRFVARSQGELFEFERRTAEEVSSMEAEFFAEYPMHDYTPPECDSSRE